MVDGFLASQTKGKGGAGKQATGAGDRAAAGAVATLDAVADGASTATAATAAPAATAAAPSAALMSDMVTNKVRPRLALFNPTPLTHTCHCLYNIPGPFQPHTSHPHIYIPPLAHAACTTCLPSFRTTTLFCKISA